MKKKVLVLASLVVMMAGLVGVLRPQTASANFFNPEPKVTICHATNSVVNPYNKIEVNQSAVNGIGNGDHYKEHKGPVATSAGVALFLKFWHIDWGDVIPPVPGFHNGLNWTTEGQALYNNNCNYVTPVTPSTVTFVDPTCDTDGTYTIPETTGVIYKIDGETVVAGQYTAQPGETVEVTAVAASAAYSLEGTTTWSHTFTTPKDCEEPEEEVADIKYGVVCSANGAVVTLTNEGNAEGSVTLNGEVIAVAASATVERTFDTTDAGLQITITIDEEVVYDQLVVCDTGDVLGEKTDTPVVLPNTSGSIAGIVAIIASLGLIAGLISLAVRSQLTRQ